MYLLDPYILQNFKKTLRVYAELWECAIFGSSEWTISPEQLFFCTNHCCYFHLPIIPFHCGKLKKNSYSGSRVMTMRHVLGQNGPFAPNKFFCRKSIIIFLIYLLAPFIVQNLKKILPADPELRGCAIFGPKMSHFPKSEFF